MCPPSLPHINTSVKPCGQESFRMCSGGQLWWKGVGGDDGGVPSRGDTSLVLTAANYSGKQLARLVCTGNRISPPGTRC